MPEPFPEDFSDQCKAYYSAKSIEHSIRDTFDDGEDEFAKIKREAWDGIRMTYRSRKYADGYERLIAVLEKVTIIINHQEGQLIVIENLDHILHLDYEASGANVITFTKRKVDGERYGFLNDVY